MFNQMNNAKLVVGYDLGDTYSQIRFYTPGQEDVETLSLVVGAQDYNIPTALCKRKGVNQWFYGREAMNYANDNQAVLIDNLLSLAVEGEPIQIEEKTVDPVALLALFFKRSLGMLSLTGITEPIAALMITSEKLAYRLIEVLSQVIAQVRMKTENVFFQSHTESFYNYMIHQPKELWDYNTVLYQYKHDTIQVYQMECNKKTTPIVAYIDCHEEEFLSYEPIPEEEEKKTVKFEQLDESFLHIAEATCGQNRISSIYLIGDSFQNEWMKNSLRYLCKGHRVFQGNNLFSKGACYGMLERLQASEEGRAHVFLGNDKLKSNIGMKIFRQGEESYYALLDAGINWYEASCDLNVYIQEGNTIELVITSLIGKGSRRIPMTLEELKGDISRLALHFYLCEENKLVVEAEDWGFGDFREATHHVWHEEMLL